MYGSFGLPIEFHIYPLVVNETHYMWNVTVFNMTEINQAKFSLIIFNSDDIAASLQYFVVAMQWYNDMAGDFLPLPVEFVDNFIMGVTAFEVLDARSGFEYQWEFTTNATFGVNLLPSITLANASGFSWS